MEKSGRRLPIMRISLIVLAVIVLAVGALVAGWLVSRSRDFQLFGEIVSRVDTSRKVVALTFDDGPTPAFTRGILDLLAEKDVKATFFLIGAEAAANPADTRAIAAAGHEIGNHTFNHPDMTLADETIAAAEVEQTDAAIRAAGYTGTILFRPPFGKKLLGLPLYLAKHGRTTVTWDVEPESFEDIAADPEKIAAHVLENTRSGSIIILHVMYPSRETSRAALPRIIDGLRAKGFSFVTASELLALRGEPL